MRLLNMGLTWNPTPWDACHGDNAFSCATVTSQLLLFEKHGLNNIHHKNVAVCGKLRPESSCSDEHFLGLPYQRPVCLSRLLKDLVHFTRFKLGITMHTLSFTIFINDSTREAFYKSSAEEGSSEPPHVWIPALFCVHIKFDWVKTFPLTLY